MLLILIAIGLILGITFFQALQGLFSSVIMAVLTLVCTLLAFNFYEPLGALLYQTQPAAAEAIALMGLLVVPLLVLRVVTDKLLAVNIAPPPWVDRAGGGLFGLFSALLLVGTLVIAVQMLPFDRAAAGYDAFSDDLKPNTMPINASGFTLGVVKFFSGGSLAASEHNHPYALNHDDLPLELWGTRNRLMGGRPDAPLDSLKVLGAYNITGQPFVSAAPPYPNADTPDNGSELVCVRAAISDSSRDKDDFWRLRGTQFRLVTEDGRSFYPIGYLMFTGQWQLRSDAVGAVAINRPTEVGRSVPGLAGKSLPIDLVYRIPYGRGQTEASKPDYLVFRRAAKAGIGKVEKGAPDSDLASTRKKVQGQVPLVTSGAATDVLFYNPKMVRIGNQLPAAFQTQQGEGDVTTATGVEAKLKGFEFVSGRIKNANESGLVTGFSQDTPGVRDFAVPKGYKLIQVPGEGPKSGVIPNLSATMQPRIRVTLPNEQTRDLPAIGGWAKWTEDGVAGRKASFVYLWYEPVPNPDQAYNVLDPELSNAYSTHLKTLTEFALLFLVPDGSTILGVQLSGGSSMLSCENPLGTD